MKFYLLVFFLLPIISISFAEEYPDRYLSAKKSQFLKDFLGRKGWIYASMGPPNGLILPNDPLHREKSQILLKNGHTLIIALGSSGRVYEKYQENDSLYFFKRLDFSSNINYNIGAYYFYFRGILHCFGGYGFWKTHGTMKIFNAKDGQWDIIPMEKEIVPQLFNIGNSWYDEKNKMLYVPYQSKINAGISGNENLKGVIEPIAYVLDLKKNKWKKLGETTEYALDLLQMGSSAISTNKGILMIKSKNLYLVDLKNNRITLDKNNLFVESLLRAMNESFMYYFNDKLYYYKPSIDRYDSIGLNFKDFALQPAPIWKKKAGLPAIAVFMALPVITLSIFLYNKSKRGKQTPESTAKKIEEFKIKFTDIEKSLLIMLENKMNQNKFASGSDINYTLGLKDKSTGLQKKVRSDTITSINKKFSYLSPGQGQLIITSRSSTDKRYFDYTISKEALELIKEYII